MTFEVLRSILSKMKSSVTLSYIGFSPEILTSDQLFEIFDQTWGKEFQGFPGYPHVIGGITAYWHSADGIKHTVSSLAELIQAYKQELTYDICISGTTNNSPRCTFIYTPFKKEGLIRVTSQTKEIAEEKIRYIKERCPIQQLPIIFISYASEELALADFIKKILRKFTQDKAEIFIARRSIQPGDDPLKIMLETNLKNAEAIIPICSRLAQESSWVWWESAAVWGRGFKIYPMYTNISPTEFGSPLNLVTQGITLFDSTDLLSSCKKICEQFGIPNNTYTMQPDELTELLKLKEGYSPIASSANVEVTYKTLKQTSELHEYSFLLEIENKTKEEFKNIVIELQFPSEYMEKKKWEYPHLTSSESRDNPGYLNLIFDYSALPDSGKKEFNKFLLPGKKIRIFGENGISNLIYSLNFDKWQNRAQYVVLWKVYINGNAPREGSTPFSSLQHF